MGTAAVSVALARSNLYLASSPEPHLRALLPSARLIRLDRDCGSTEPALPTGLLFPLDAVVALSGGVDEDGASTLIRFVGSNEFLRLDPLSCVRVSQVVRAGYAIFIAQAVWMAFGSRFPCFLEPMVEFAQGRNALSIVNATCYSSHRYAKRLARLLLEVHDAMPEREECIPLSQMEIGLLMNTRRETIALEMLDLSAAGIVETGRARIRIRDLDGLRKRSCGCYGRSVDLAMHQLQIARRFLGSVPIPYPDDRPIDLHD